MKVPRKRIVSMNGDVFGHFLLSAITIMMDKGVELTNPDEYDVNLTVNGVELPVEEVFMYWHDKLNSSVDQRAEELFAEKFRDVGKILNDFAQTISIEMDNAKMEICNKLNLKYISDETT